MRAFLLAMAASALFIPDSAQAEDVVLEPSSPWHLDYGADKCRLARTFGEGEQKTILFLDQYQPSSSFTWTIAGPPVEAVDSANRYTSQFGPGLTAKIIKGFPGPTLGKLEGYGAAIIQSGHRGDDEGESGDVEESAISLPHLAAEEGGQIEWLEIRRGRHHSLRLLTGNMRAPFDAMNKCMADLLADWGLDVETQRRRVNGPEWTNIRRVVRKIQDHYPSKALDRGAQARLNMRIMVGTDGRPTGCVLTDVTKADNFDDAPCQIVMREARFEPARDAQNQPVPSYYATSIVYAIGS